MMTLGVLSLMFGIGFDPWSLLIYIVVFGGGGFFMWRAILRSLAKKGPKGIRTAAIIVGAIYTPIVVCILALFFSSWALMREREKIMENYHLQDYYDSIPGDTLDFDTTDLELK